MYFTYKKELGMGNSVTKYGIYFAENEAISVDDENKILKLKKCPYLKVDEDYAEFEEVKPKRKYKKRKIKEKEENETQDEPQTEAEATPETEVEDEAE